MSEPTKMRAPVHDQTLHRATSGARVFGLDAELALYRELLAYRTRYGDIDAPPKSPQPVAGDCTWLGECEPPKTMTFGARFLRPEDRAQYEEELAGLRLALDAKCDQVDALKDRAKRACDAFDSPCRPDELPDRIANLRAGYQELRREIRDLDVLARGAASQVSRLAKAIGSEATDPEFLLADAEALKSQVAALRAEVERRDEIIATESALRVHAFEHNKNLEDSLHDADLRAVEAAAVVKRAERAEACVDALIIDRDTAEAEAATYRRAIVECITMGYNEAVMLRTMARTFLTADDMDPGF